MSLQRPGTGRSLVFLNALLLSTALGGPAMAQIEQVIVTAQHKSEDVQTVPIAISAFSAQDLAAHQIENAKDLQFNIPNVTFTHGNFGPSNFQIRGIGSAAVTTSGDSGVAVDLNEIYLANPPLTSGVYYDVENLQVQRGAQSTLWGRNATGGVIDTETVKPDLDSFGGNLEATYGNFDDKEIRAAINMPIVEGQLAARVAAYWQDRDGYIDNVYNSICGASGTCVPGVANKVNSRDLYSVRGSVRWEPTSRTVVDFMVQYGNEDDSRTRSDVQLCHRDPSGVLGCLPDSLQHQAINSNATLGNVVDSDLGPLAGTPFWLYPLTVADGWNASMGGGTAFVPSSLRAVDTSFTPTNSGNDLYFDMHWKQTLTNWLTSDTLVGYDLNSGVSKESYDNAPGDSYNLYPETPIQQFLTGGNDGLNAIENAQLLYCATFTGFNCNLLTAKGLGYLPESGVGNNGLVGNNIRGYFNSIQGDDQISGKDRNWSIEQRFTTSFDGPLNGMLGLYYLNYYNNAQYFVNSNSLDYFGTAVGGITQALSGGFACPGANGCILGPTQYDNNSAGYQLNSQAIYGELYYDALPDTLKLTGGLRYSHDSKSFVSRQTLFNDYEPFPCGDSCNDSYVTAGQLAFGNAPLPFLRQHANFDSLTGRGVVDWTPQLDFTDKTLVYASYSKGYRAGGFNPPSFLNPGANNTFAPEKVDDYELGTKNTLFGGILNANLTAFYYNYQNYQISEIVNRTSVNLNINSKLWGVEGEFFYAPTDKLLFNSNFGYENSRLVNTSLIDTRDPTAGQKNVTLIKDAGNGANCVITNQAGFISAEAALTNLVVAPPVPTPGVYASGFSPASAATADGIHFFNVCQLLDATPQGATPSFQQVLQYMDPTAVGHYHLYSGIAKNLSGNEMPLTPPWTFNIGVQYTFDLPGGYSLVPRADFYWKDNMWARIWEDGADRINSWSETNAQIQLNAPDSIWYARFWVQNVFDQENITGEYVTDPTSALFSNAFVEEPRTYGITLGANF